LSQPDAVDLPALARAVAYLRQPAPEDDGPGEAPPSPLERLRIALGRELGALGAELRAGHPEDTPLLQGDTARWPLWLDGQPPVLLVARWPDRLPGGLEAALQILATVASASHDARLYAGARQAVRARDEFIGIASHEMRTPISSLLVAVQSLMRARSGLASRPERLQKVLITAERQAKRLTRLMDNLFDVATIQGGRLELAPEEVDLGDIAHEAVANLAVESDSAGIPITVRSEGPVVGVWDRLRLERVVENLVGNAIKYGEGRPVELRVAASGPDARLEVEDHGIGIAPESHAQIFQQFTRVAARPTSGLGLGLYIVRQFLTAMGGTIELTSRPGHGSVFTVRLPRRPAAT
jgi:signal transduction histidine kinase